MASRTLKSAAEHGDIEGVKVFLARGVDVNARNAAGHFPLGGAAYFGHAHVMSVLLKHGANINQRSAYGWTPLYIAAWNGHSDAVQLLLKAGARLDFKTKGGYNSPNGYEALHIAAERGHGKIVKFLIADHADVNSVTGDGDTPLTLALKNGDSLMAKLLIKSGADIKVPTSLHAAVQGGKRPLVKLLLKSGMPLNEVDDFGYSPLHFAAQCVECEMAKMLLATRKTKVNLRNNEGDTALGLAIKGRYIDTAIFLLLHGGTI